MVVEESAEIRGAALGESAETRGVVAGELAETRGVVVGESAETQGVVVGVASEAPVVEELAEIRASKVETSVDFWKALSVDRLVSEPHW
jgi:hypothetical protein